MYSKYACTLNKLKLLIFLFFSIVIIGCRSSDDLEVSMFMQRLDEIQTKQVFIQSSIDELDSVIRVYLENLSTDLDPLTNINQQLSTIKQKKKASEKNVLSVIQLYKSGYANYLEGDFEDAIESLNQFISLSKQDNEFYGDAIFFLGDAYLSTKQYSKSLILFDKRLGYSERSRQVVLLKRSYCFQGLKDTTNQVLTLKTLVQEFPQSIEAQIAIKILKEYESQK